MKRNIVLIFIMCLIMTVGCIFFVKGECELSNSQNNTKPIEAVAHQLPFNDYRALSCRNDINEFINNNPIDKEFNKHEIPSSTAEIIEFYGKYIDFWEAELDNALMILNRKLDEKSLKYLNSAQSNWTEYLKCDISTLSEIHIEIVGSGSEIPILNSYRVLSKVRERALELIEYCILLENSYEFLF